LWKLLLARDSGQFLKQLDSYNASSIGDQAGEKVWEGHVAIASKLNENVTTAIPISEAVPAMKPGVYVITASAVGPKGNDDYDSKVATQWFVVTDLGLTSLSGHDGVHAIVRSLSTAKPVAGVKVRLVATDNDILGEAVTDADGHVRFDPGLARGLPAIGGPLLVAPPRKHPSPAGSRAAKPGRGLTD